MYAQEKKEQKQGRHKWQPFGVTVFVQDSVTDCVTRLILIMLAIEGHLYPTL